MENKTGKYFKYAIGEIVLVVIGILIALSINNWNEDNKAKENEVYILNEIIKNLEEDVLLVSAIISKRENAKLATNSIFGDTNIEKTPIDKLQSYLVHLLTFERYFPINNAYEILKAKGLQLSNNELTSNISRYYDYEQNKISSSILDIEGVVLKSYNDPKSFIRFITIIDKDKRMILKDPLDPIFKEELLLFLRTFKDNNEGTLEKLIMFRNINMDLSEEIKKELISINQFL
jgi:hypothetical protein